MALDINGYNTDFNAFVKFAQNSFVTNDKTAVARFEVGGAPLGGRRRGSARRRRARRSARSLRPRSETTSKSRSKKG